METLGKLLSLVLVTFIGMAATYLYVVEYDGKAVKNDMIIDQQSQDNKDISVITKYRRELRDFKPIEVPERNINPDKAPLWGEEPPDSFSGEKIRAESERVAAKYTIEDINKEIQFWHSRYKELIKDTSKKEEARNAYLKFKIYQLSAELKSSK